MRAHGHGGTLLVVPAEIDHWRESIVHPIIYFRRTFFFETRRFDKERSES